MTDTLKSFGHIVRATPEILRNGKPTILNEDGWRFAVEAMCAMGIQKKKNEGPSEEARIFELMCMSEEVGTEFWRKTVPTYFLVDEKFEFVAKAIVAFADEQVEG